MAAYTAGITYELTAYRDCDERPPDSSCHCVTPVTFLSNSQSLPGGVSVRSIST